LIRNLLENARRHGQTPIRTALRREAAGELVLTVDDSGAGVAEAEREKIFEPFYRPKGHRETQDGGVGLGLFLVKSLVEHHGGQVRYVAMPHGSRFEVRLPT
jgi:signal transduction histidine kinase